MKFTVKFTSSQGSDAFIERLGQFDSLVTAIVKDAMAQTLLKAIKERYQVNRERMGTFQEIEREVAPVSPSGIERMAKVRAALQQAHATRKAFFFERVADLLTNSKHIETHMEGDSVVALMGRIRDLDAIKSPSATQILSKHNSRSPYKILWRQMEFGTGMLRKPGESPFVPTRYTSSEGWWYGPPNSKGAVHFRGTHPGNLLRTQTGIPYSQDALSFYRLFGTRMIELLRGR